jgi:hypothetical protein
MSKCEVEHTDSTTSSLKFHATISTGKLIFETVMSYSIRISIWKSSIALDHNSNKTVMTEINKYLRIRRRKI